MRADEIISIQNKPSYFLVPASDGKSYHEVNGRTFSCDCPDFQFRRAGTIHFCRHGRALKNHLDRLSACPACGGRGFHVARGGPYASGNDPLPCTTCEGSGRKETADPRLVALFDREQAEKANAELLELFR